MNLSLPSKGAGSRLRGGGLRHAEEGLPGVFCVLPPSSCFGEAERLSPSRPRTPVARVVWCGVVWSASPRVTAHSASVVGVRGTKPGPS